LKINAYSNFTNKYDIKTENKQSKIPPDQPPVKKYQDKIEISEKGKQLADASRIIPADNMQHMEKAENEMQLGNMRDDVAQNIIPAERLEEIKRNVEHRYYDEPRIIDSVAKTIADEIRKK